MTSHNVIASNAFNMSDFINHGVDPRTGQYTATVNFPAINGNLLCGPSLPMTLGFSPINTRDSGFGTGWSLALSQYDPSRKVLSLANGKTFKVTGSGPTPEIAEHKLEDFRFYDEGGRRYRVVHKSGMVEVLERRGISGYVLALPVEIFSPEGHRITLTYETYGNYQRLSQVHQADGTLLLSLGLAGSSLNIRYYGSGPGNTPATYLLQVQAGQLRQLLLPTHDNARWSFTYEILGNYTCLKTVRTPQGAVETIDHAGQHLFPGGQQAPLPRVTRHLVDPGREQPVLETRYTYSPHNFLGYLAQGLLYRDDGLDNLYRVTEPYEYFTVQERWHDGKAGRSVKSLYNRYHLLTQKTITHGNSQQICITEYPVDDTLSFDLQVAQCQLPHRTINRWTLVDDPTRLRDEIEVLRFDAHGNMVEKVESCGARQTWAYYSALGEVGCPADPYGFTRWVKEHRRYAAPPPKLRGPRRNKVVRGSVAPIKLATPPPPHGDEPVFITRCSYTTHPPLRGGPVPTLVLDQTHSIAQTDAGEQLLLTARYSYVDSPDIPEQHGKQRSIIEDKAGHTSTLVTDYDFVEQPGTLKIKQHISHGLDGSSRQTLQRVALYSHRLLEEHTLEGRVLTYEYDALGRLVGESVMAADAGYPARRTYHHAWPATAGSFAEHRTTDAQGIVSVVELDGLGRTLRQLQQRGDGSANQDDLVQRYSARYGHDLELLEETVHDWLDAQALPTTRCYEYDEWDQRSRVIDTDGVSTYTLVDPFELTVTEWRDGMAKTVTRNNLYGKVDWVATYPAGTEPGQSWLDRQRFFYDGHGQLRLSLVTSGGRTAHDYDAFGRMIRTRLPDRTCIEQDYAEHSTAALVTQLQITHGHRAGLRQVAGSRQYDGLDRVTQTTVGPRTSRYRYRDNLDVVEEHITPAQKSIRYDYDLGLSNAPTATDADEQCTFAYHPVTASLTQASTPHSTLDYQYDGNGRLIQERSQTQGVTRQTRYHTSPGGRLVQSIEQTGNSEIHTRMAYDAYGRAKQLDEGQLQASFEYNELGQLARTTTQDLANGNIQVTELEYDSRGREIVRTQRLSRSPEHRTQLTWGVTGHLLARELSVGGQLSLRETFIHDVRGRLIEHRCTGPDLPRDPYANPIVGQQFDFDALDNLRFCTSYFADGSEDEARHYYADDDPCQLRSQTHTHPDYPMESLFSYDADGNLLTDGRGLSLHYDRQGRLLQVDAADGTLLSRYRYDAHDQLLGVTRGSAAEGLRYYQGTQLRSAIAAGQHQCFSYAGAVPLGQQCVGAPEQTLLTLCGASHSVLAEVKGQGPVKRTQYTSHGDASEVLDSVLAFNGEVREPDTGWYLLGNGYRAYDPQLRCFLRPDSESPFGAGGLNPYSYCLGNPVGMRDPTGHMARYIGYEIGQWDIARRKQIDKGWTASVLIGTAFNVGFGLLLAPVSGGLSVVAMVVGQIELVARATIVAEIEKVDGNQDIIMAFDIASMAGDLLQVGYAAGKHLSKKVSQLAVSKAMKEAAEESLEAAASQLTRPATSGTEALAQSAAGRSRSLSAASSASPDVAMKASNPRKPLAVVAAIGLPGLMGYSIYSTIKGWSVPAQEGVASSGAVVGDAGPSMASADSPGLMTSAPGAISQATSPQNSGGSETTSETLRTLLHGASAQAAAIRRPSDSPGFAG